MQKDIGQTSVLEVPEPVKTVRGLITVMASEKDALAVETINYLFDGNSDRHPREIVSEPIKNDDVRLLDIYYGPGKEIVSRVEIILVPGELREGADWYVRSASIGHGLFTSNLKRISTLDSRSAIKFKGHQVVLNIDRDSKDHRRLARQAANVMAAKIVGQNAFRNNILSCPGSEESRHFKSVSKWIADADPIKLVSGCCLNADETRTDIVNEFDHEIIDLLVRASRYGLSTIPNIRECYIYSFGPKDFAWLGELGISQVLLPYMWNAPAEKVLSDLQRNHDLMEGLVDKLNRNLPFPVILGQASDHMESIDLPWLIESSHERARVMMPKIMENPPLIFKQLNSDEECYARVQQESFLYLMDTIRWGQKLGEDRDRVLYMGLEVHGGYWQYGNLFDGPDGEFLPLSWFPQCIRQHWGKWVTRNTTMQKQRRNLGFTLNYAGY